MVTLISPNGVKVEAAECAVEGMLRGGFKRLEAEKPKAAPRKRTAKPKEQ